VVAGALALALVNTRLRPFLLPEPYLQRPRSGRA